MSGYIAAVTMFAAQCPRCADQVSAAPRPSRQDAYDDLVAHFHVVHEIEPPSFIAACIAGPSE